MTEPLTLDCETTTRHWLLIPSTLKVHQGGLVDGVWRYSGPSTHAKPHLSTEGVEQWATYTWACGDHTHTVAGPKRTLRMPCESCGKLEDGVMAPAGHNFSGGPNGRVVPCRCCNGTGEHPMTERPACGAQPRMVLA